MNIGRSCESLRVIFECFAFGKLISIYMMTNPPSHRCENYFEPDQLRGDLDSKNNVSKYKQLLILFVNL